MKYNVMKDEWWPMYSFTDNNYCVEATIDIDEKTYKRLTKAFKEFDKAHTELIMLVNKAIKEENDTDAETRGTE